MIVSILACNDDERISDRRRFGAGSHPHGPSAFEAARISPSNAREAGETFVVFPTMNSVSHFIDCEAVVPRLKASLSWWSPTDCKAGSLPGTVSCSKDNDQFSFWMSSTRRTLPSRPRALRRPGNFPRRLGSCRPSARSILANAERGPERGPMAPFAARDPRPKPKHRSTETSPMSSQTGQIAFSLRI